MKNKRLVRKSKKKKDKQPFATAYLFERIDEEQGYVYCTRAVIEIFQSTAVVKLNFSLCQAQKIPTA